MAGRPRGAEPRSGYLRIRVTPTAERIIDAARGGMTRSDYVRSLIAADAERKGIK